MRTGGATVGSLADPGRSLTQSNLLQGQAFGNIAAGVAKAGATTFGDLGGLEWLDRFSADLRRNNLPRV